MYHELAKKGMKGFTSGHGAKPPAFPHDGRSDTVPATVQAGSYVVPAARLSKYGRGSTEAGHARLMRDVAEGQSALAPKRHDPASMEPQSLAIGGIAQSDPTISYAQPQGMQGTGLPGGFQEQASAFSRPTGGAFGSPPQGMAHGGVAKHKHPKGVMPPAATSGLPQAGTPGQPQPQMQGTAGGQQGQAMWQMPQPQMPQGGPQMPQGQPQGGMPTPAQNAPQTPPMPSIQPNATSLGQMSGSPDGGDAAYQGAPQQPPGMAKGGVARVPGKMVPVNLSVGEAVLTPQNVSAVGRGNYEIGKQKLDNLGKYQRMAEVNALGRRQQAGAASAFGRSK
jgi:hypothetical protein